MATTHSGGRKKRGGTGRSGGGGTGRTVRAGRGGGKGRAKPGGAGTRRSAGIAHRADTGPVAPDTLARRQRQEREKRILDAAVTLMLRWGFRKTTIDDVAREAGVGKGTIYLHWKDKNELFAAALRRESQQTIDDMLERVRADADGGQFHRLFTHGMTALYANPLLASLMSGKSDLARGLIGTLDTSTLSQLFGNSEAQVTRLQRAGLIRDDIPAGLVMFLMGALKMGIISASEIAPKGQAPTVDQLTEGLSDLIRRWLQPEGKREDGAEGKKIMAEWMESYRTIGMTRRRTED